MISSTWEQRNFSALRAIANICEQTGQDARVNLIINRTGFSETDVDRAITALIGE